MATNEQPPRDVAVVPRPGVAGADVESLMRALAGVPWAELQDAYGPARDVPAQLLAVVVAHDHVRTLAWYELWGNVHHQGTVYEATVPAVPFLADVARSSGHPERVEALYFLREIALGDGTCAGPVRDAVRSEAELIVRGWRGEPEFVQRAVLWLCSAFPDLVRAEPNLVDLVPPELRPIWAETLEGAGGRRKLSEEVMDRQVELERWALAGWPSGLEQGDFG